jgi:hypothetical protein
MKPPYNCELNNPHVKPSKADRPYMLVTVVIDTRLAVSNGNRLYNTPHTGFVPLQADSLDLRLNVQVLKNTSRFS